SFQRLLSDNGYEAGGQGPVLTDGGMAVRTYLYVSKIGASHPQAGFANQVRMDRSLFIAEYRLLDDGQWIRYYSGPFADAESLSEATEASIPRILTEVLALYAQRLSETIGQ